MLGFSQVGKKERMLARLWLSRVSGPVRARRYSAAAAVPPLSRQKRCEVEVGLAE